MDYPSNMNKNQSSMIVLFFLALAVLLALLYLDFYLYGTKKLLSERITITEGSFATFLPKFDTQIEGFTDTYTILTAIIADYQIFSNLHTTCKTTLHHHSASLIATSPRKAT